MAFVPITIAGSISFASIGREMSPDGKLNLMHQIASLIEDHDLMEALADRLIAMARPGQGEAALCHALLTDLAQRHASHQAVEMEFLRVDRCRPASPFDREVALFEAQFSTLDESWSDYLKRWSVKAIGSDRLAFCSETMDMMTALKLRFACENELLYPLALEAGRIACTPAPLHSSLPRRLEL